VPKLLTTAQLEILQHSLGVDQYGQGEIYRNRFCAGQSDEKVCLELIALGYMQRHRTTELFPDLNCSVTDAGKQAVREQSPKPPKLTRGQKRYREYLNWADAWGGTFREFLEHKQQVAAQRAAPAEVGL
jgi:hypothetical protein